MPDNGLLDELEQRGFLADCTDRATLAARLREGPTKIFVGFDPTASSLHVGSLMPLFVQRMVRHHGHLPVLLVGGATGLIGDPSGRSDSRPVLDNATIDHNRACLRAQMIRLVGVDGNEPILVDNRDWLAHLSFIDFLRDIAPHFSVNAMLARDSVKLRRDADVGLSLTEFTYQVLQAFDFWWLQTNLDVEVQVGGSDQWGNITAGLDFMRRRGRHQGWGLVWPLLTKADGTKFGKTASGNVWLSSERTSPFEFWQFWFGVEDADVNSMLLRFCNLPVAQIQELVARHRAHPHKREAQRVLANAVTTWVHGHELAASAEAAASILFRPGATLNGASLDLVERELGSLRIPRHDLLGISVVDLAVRGGLCSSRGEARRVAQAAGLQMGGDRVDAARTVVFEDICDPGWIMLCRGPKRRLLVRATD